MQTEIALFILKLHPQGVQLAVPLFICCMAWIQLPSCFGIIKNPLVASYWFKIWSCRKKTHYC